MPGFEKKKVSFLKASWIALVLVAFLSQGALLAETGTGDKDKDKDTPKKTTPRKRTPKKVTPPAAEPEVELPTPKPAPKPRKPRAKKEDAAATPPAPIADTDTATVPPVAPPPPRRRRTPLVEDDASAAGPAEKTGPTVADGIRIPKILPKVGIELEYAAKDELKDPATEDVDPERYKGPLRKLKELFGGGGSEVKLMPWEKDREYSVGWYKDPFDRVWTVVPEVVNSHAFKDGYEIVTPPLDRPQDQEIFKKLVKAVEDTGKYEKGLKSSVHFTVDASHLIEGGKATSNADASKLVDTILYIENHWPEIYGAISPTRYGTIVNRFGVPLAGEPKMKELLDQLAALKPNERTYGKVREIFENFHAIEETIPFYRKDAWKFRAAQYKKLFGLGGVDQRSVIEFRLGDMVDSATLTKQMEFYQRLMAMAHRIEPNQTVFRDPFKGAPVHTDFEETEREKRYFDELNKVIVEQPKEGYATFLKKLGFFPREFPLNGRFHGPLTQGLTRQELTDMIEKFDTSGPVTFGPSQEKATFGWEVELPPTGLGLSGVMASVPWWLNPKNFWPGNWQQDKTASIFGIRTGFKLAPWDMIRSRYRSYLNPEVTREETKNIELTSKPQRILDAAVDQMIEVREATDREVMGFHLHIRIPKEGWQGIPKEELEGFLSRVADVGLAWRLKYRRAWYALNTQSVKRLKPDYIEDRATIRAQSDERQTEEAGTREPKDFKGALDIELRGFMDDAESAKRLAKIILIAFKNPEMMKGFAATQSALFQKKIALADAVNEYKKQYRGGPLTPAEKKFLDSLEYTMGLINPEKPGQPYWKESTNYDGTNWLPLMGFQDAEWLSPLQRHKIKEADKSFARNMYYLMVDHMKEGSDPTVPKGEVAAQSRTKIKIWAVESDFHASLEGSLLLLPERAAKAETTVGDERQARFALYTHKDPAVIEKAVAMFRDMKDAELIAALPGLTTSAPPYSRQKILEMIGERKAPEFLGFLLERLADEHPEVRETAARILGARRGTKVADKALVEKLIELSKTSNNPSEESAAIKTLALRPEPAAKVAVQHLLVDDKQASAMAELEAVKAIGDRGTPERAPMFGEQEALELLEEVAVPSHFTGEQRVDVRKEVLRSLMLLASNTDSPETRDKAIELLYRRAWPQEDGNGEPNLEVQREAVRMLTELAPYLTDDQLKEVIEEMRDSRGVSEIVAARAADFMKRVKSMAKTGERALAYLWRHTPVANKLFKEWSAAKTEVAAPVEVGRDGLGFDRATPEFRKFVLKAAEQLANRTSEGDTSVLEAIASGLESKDAEVRDYASRALAKRAYKDDHGASELIAKALKHKDPTVVRNAAAALRGWEDAEGWSEGVIPLIKTLLEHKDAKVRVAAASALAERGGGSGTRVESAKLILDNLKHPDIEVRVELVKALAGRKDADAKNALTIALGSREPLVKAAAIAAMSSNVEEGGTLEAQTKLALIPLLRSTEEVARREAIRGIARLSPEELAKLGQDYFNRAPTEGNLKEREGVILAMLEMISLAKDDAKKAELRSTFEPIFQKAMNDPSPVLLESAFAFYKGQEPLTVLRALKIAGKATDPATKQWALKKLAEGEFTRLTPTQEKEYVSIAEESLGHPIEEVRKAASLALSKRGSKAVVEVLRAAVAPGGNALRRQAAAEALVGMKGAHSVPVLAQVLADADPVMRRIGAQALKGNHEVGTIGLYTLALRDSDPAVRANAASSLINWTENDVWPVLVEALKHGEADVSTAALEAFRVWAAEAAIGSTSVERQTELRQFKTNLTAEVRELLLKHLQDQTNPNLKEAAKKALAALSPDLFKDVFNDGFGKNKPWLDRSLAELLALRKGDNYDKIEGMLKTALRSSDKEVLKAAHAMLKERGTTAFLDAANATLVEGVPAEAKRQVAEALRNRFGNIVPDQFRVRVADILKELSEGPDRRKRKALLEELGNLVPSLNESVAAALSLPDLQRRAALEAIETERLQKISQDDRREILKTIELALTSTDPDVRRLGSETLKPLHYDEAVALIATLISHDNPVVRKAALAALPGRTDITSLTLLQTTIQTHEDPNVKHETMRILKQRTDQAALAVLDNVKGTDLGTPTAEAPAGLVPPSSTPRKSGRIRCAFDSIVKKVRGGG